MQTSNPTTASGRRLSTSLRDLSATTLAKGSSLSRICAEFRSMFQLILTERALRVVWAASRPCYYSHAYYKHVRQSRPTRTARDCSTTLGLFLAAICLTKGSKNCATNTPNVSAGSKKHGHSHQVR